MKLLGGYGWMHWKALTQLRYKYVPLHLFSSPAHDYWITLYVVMVMELTWRNSISTNLKSEKHYEIRLCPFDACKHIFAGGNTSCPFHSWSVWFHKLWKGFCCYPNANGLSWVWYIPGGRVPFIKLSTNYLYQSMSIMCILSGSMKCILKCHFHVFTKVWSAH